MTFREINSNYILSDGQIISCIINFAKEKFVIVNLKVRKLVDKNYSDVFLELKFSNLTEFYLSEDFTDEYYSDITFLILETGEYYLSLDPYGNSNTKNENDNFIIKARDLDVFVK